MTKQRKLTAKRDEVYKKLKTLTASAYGEEYLVLDLLVDMPDEMLSGLFDDLAQEYAQTGGWQ